MSNKSLLVLVLCSLLLLTGVVAWRLHQKHSSTAMAAAQNMTDINCALGCKDDAEMNLKPREKAGAQNNPVPVLAPAHTCMEAITSCLSENGDLSHCSQQTSCSTACKEAIIREVIPAKENRLDKLNELFILESGACHT
jgi:hypothetical protein